MNEIKLLPCPFCNGEARLQRKNKKHGYYIVCKKCGCRTPYYQYQFSSLEKLRNEAITTWNTREPIEEIVRQLKNQVTQYNNRAHELVQKSTEAGIHNKGKALSYECSIDIVKEVSGVK